MCKKIIVDLGMIEKEIQIEYWIDPENTTKRKFLVCIVTFSQQGCTVMPNIRYVVRQTGKEASYHTYIGDAIKEYNSIIL